VAFGFAVHVVTVVVVLAGFVSVIVAAAVVVLAGSVAVVAAVAGFALVGAVVVAAAVATALLDVTVVCCGEEREGKDKKGESSVVAPFGLVCTLVVVAAAAEALGIVFADYFVGPVVAVEETTFVALVTREKTFHQRALGCAYPFAQGLTSQPV
jgi:hypothetical protein